MVDLKAEFPLHHDVLYLNHAAVAPWPRRTRDAVVAFANQNIQVGARDYPQWARVEQRLRDRLGWLINVEPADVALLKNTSEGLSVIAQGLDWRAGDQVVISDQEFPSNRIPWQALADQGVEVVEVDVSGPDAEQRVIDAIGERTRLVSLSSVQYGSGIRLNLAPIGRACRDSGVLFCVDAIQSLGAVRFDSGEVYADFVVADGHKWMLGPEGLALFYCRPAVRERLRLRQFGWHMIANAGDYSQTGWRVAEDARRFECGSPNMLGAHALDASLSLFQELGMDTVARALAERIGYLDSALRDRGAEVLSPAQAERRAGIVTFRLMDEAPADTRARLQAGGVVCAERGGGVRFSPHFYTDYSVMDRAVALL
ncbi:MAG TPA: aminotransferase [Alcanivorax sp.]|jgi:cysteine desulfurase / selenocysteine lyase|uniref:aminotransferase class V-fold PLP-dependent enzyme n=1 Tax=Alloalcanivorax venustensis TaxID=172371 RepID=UPI000C947624|nr:aminotransferase [Alcanivorax sp.]MBA4730919.1 aminotransferase class V-fold PLP-dependent enzyme [Alcanivorax sp.]HAD46409.1 aminotransferase [Alcanivorax sp.]HAI36054.1 aminotransferase [Alcanivorax sp.]HAI90126.1 aminotransferase [Alcanivorax sp.]|tara:strand:- start:10615 stop:11724 length:1110 start_codon:yes stop_codon:yes gene_type:complete